jgi:hypothetical protein
MPIKMTMEISDEKAAVLERLMQECGFDDWKDYLNSEFTLLEYAAQAIKEGKSIGIVDEVKEVYKEIKMPFMERLRPSVQA